MFVFALCRCLAGLRVLFVYCWCLSLLTTKGYCLFDLCLTVHNRSHTKRQNATWLSTNEELLWDYKQNHYLKVNINFGTSWRIWYLTLFSGLHYHLCWSYNTHVISHSHINYLIITITEQERCLDISSSASAVYSIPYILKVAITESSGKLPSWCSTSGCTKSYEMSAHSSKA